MSATVAEAMQQHIIANCRKQKAAMVRRREQCVPQDAVDSSGLSRLQKILMEFVRQMGYVTSYDANHYSFSGNSTDNASDEDFHDALRRDEQSAKASASRALRRLIERGLLIRVRSRYHGYSDVFVSPQNTDAPPMIKRRLAEVEGLRMTPFVCDLRDFIEGLDKTEKVTTVNNEINRSAVARCKQELRRCIKKMQGAAASGRAKRATEG